MVFGVLPSSQGQLICVKHLLFYVIKELVSRGARIKAYDPKAIGEAKAHYLKGVQNITYITSKYDVLRDSDALV